MSKFKIALPGFDVHSSQVGEEALDSQYPNPKINAIANPPHVGIIDLDWVSTSITVPANSEKILYSFPHGYDYVPTCIGVYHFDNGTNPSSGILPFQYGALGLILLDADSININLKWVSFDGGTTIPNFIMQVRFYVMAERGNE